MKRSIMGASALALLVLAGCAQKPAPEAGFKSQSAASYVQAHGLKVDMQLPQAFVGASTVIDSRRASFFSSASFSVRRRWSSALTFFR